MRDSKTRIDPNRLALGGDCFIELILLAQRHAECGMCFREIRIETDRFVA